MATAGKLFVSILIIATSVLMSEPITFALNSLLSFSFTVTSSESPTTCAFVKI